MGHSWVGFQGRKRSIRREPGVRDQLVPFQAPISGTVWAPTDTLKFRESLLSSIPPSKKRPLPRLDPFDRSLIEPKERRVMDDEAKQALALAVIAYRHRHTRVSPRRTGDIQKLRSIASVWSIPNCRVDRFRQAKKLTSQTLMFQHDCCGSNKSQRQRKSPSSVKQPKQIS